VRLLVCTHNSGATELAAELAAQAAQAQPKLDYRVLTDAAAMKDATHVLLYLNDRTFGDGGATAQLVRDAMDAGVTMVLVQELDPGLGACAFRRFFDVTPNELLKQRKLFDTLAVPLYPSEAHRAVSILYVVRAMGASPPRFWQRAAAAPKRSDAGRPFRRFWQRRKRAPPPPMLSATKSARWPSLRGVRSSVGSLRSSIGASFRQSLGAPSNAKAWLGEQAPPPIAISVGSSSPDPLELSKRRAGHAHAIAGSFAALRAADAVSAYGGGEGSGGGEGGSRDRRDTPSGHHLRREHLARRAAAANPWRTKPPPPLGDAGAARMSSQLSIYGEEADSVAPSRRGSLAALRRAFRSGKQRGSAAAQVQHEEGSWGEASAGSPQTQGRGRQISTHI
jgi:hypothetical protein